VTNAWPCLVLTALVLASCNRPAITPSESLVGATRLPPARALSRELIQINRGLGEMSAGFLSYELRPDNTLTITLSDRGGYRERVRGTETFRIPPGPAAQVRRNLWRLRPQELEGVDVDIRPVGCPSRPHDVGELAVAFIGKGPRPGVEDDPIGIFALPNAGSCATRQATEARRLLQSVIQSLPASKVAADYHRRVRQTHTSR
jgi:hypothetical protein